MSLKKSLLRSSLSSLPRSTCSLASAIALRNVAYHSRRIKLHRGSDDSGIKIHRNATLVRVYSCAYLETGSRRAKTHGDARETHALPEWDVIEFTSRGTDCEPTARLPIGENGNFRGIVRYEPTPCISWATWR